MQVRGARAVVASIACVILSMVAYAAFAIFEQGARAMANTGAGAVLLRSVSLQSRKPSMKRQT